MVTLAPHTCPDIAEAISNFEVYIDSIVDTMYEDILDNIDISEHEELKKILYSYKQDITNEFDTYANRVRETNESLRDSAYEAIDYYKEQAGLYEH